MQASEMTGFMEILVVVAELHSKRLSKQLTELYWKLLEGFELSEVEEAFRAHLRSPDTGQYFPKPADIIRFIEGSGETKALQA